VAALLKRWPRLTAAPEPTKMVCMEARSPAPWDLRVVAAVAAVLLFAGLGAFLWLDPVRAREVVSEHGPVEWAQAGWLVAGWLVTIGRLIHLLARSRPAVAELLLAVLLTVGISAELSLHNWAGFRIRHWQLSLRPSAPSVSPWVVLSVSVIVVLTAALYVLHHRRSLMAVVRDVPLSRWGQFTIAGCGGYAIAHIVERRSARLMRGFFIEETIELVAAFCLFLAAWQRAHAPGDEEYQDHVRRGLEAVQAWLIGKLPGSEVVPFSDPELPERLYVVHVGVGSNLPRVVKFREAFLADNHAAMPAALAAAGILRRLSDTAGPIVIPAGSL
jgi:hypothetical protein